MIGGNYYLVKASLKPRSKFWSYGIAKSALVALMKQYALEAADSKKKMELMFDRIKLLLNTI